MTVCDVTLVLAVMGLCLGGGGLAIAIASARNIRRTRMRLEADYQKFMTHLREANQ